MKKMGGPFWVVAWFVIGGLGGELVADEAATRKITVSGVGTVSVVPDMARITTGVMTQSSNASEALTQNSAAVQRVFEVLKEAKIADRDIQTSSFNVSPVYEREPQRNTNRISGYRVSNQVTVRVRKLADLGDVLDALVRAGSNQISGVAFDVDEKAGLMDSLRKSAMADARHRATVLAGEADSKVGRVLSISEAGNIMPRPQPMMARFAAEASVPIAAGEQEFQIQVTVVYELTD